MASTPLFHRAVIVGSESLASAPTMKRCAICLTPVAAIAATGRLGELAAGDASTRRRALRGLARVVEQLVQVAGDVGGRRARRADVDEAEERRAQRGVAHQQFLHAPLDPRGRDRARTGHAGGEIGADRADRRLEVLEALLGRGGHGSESSCARGPSPRRSRVATIRVRARQLSRLGAAAAGRGARAGGRRRVLQVESGDLLDALQTAVQRGSVHAKGISRGRHVAAVLEQALERLDQLRRAPVLGERDDRRGRLRAARRRPTARRSAPSCRAGRRRRRDPGRRARTARRRVAWRSASGASARRAKGALTPPVAPASVSALSEVDRVAHEQRVVGARRSRRGAGAGGRATTSETAIA